MCIFFMNVRLIVLWAYSDIRMQFGCCGGELIVSNLLVIWEPLRWNISDANSKFKLLKPGLESVAEFVDGCVRDGLSYSLLHPLGHGDAPLTTDATVQTQDNNRQTRRGR